jgi:hypothetical protein
MHSPGSIGRLDQRNQRFLTGQGSWPVDGHLATTNVCAEVDLEMKAKALTRCEEEEEGQAQQPWREDKGLMEFLRNL